MVTSPVSVTAGELENLEIFPVGVCAGSRGGVGLGMCAWLKEKTSVPITSVVAPMGNSRRSVLASAVEPVASELLVSLSPLVRKEGGLVFSSGLLLKSSVVPFRPDVSSEEAVRAREGLSSANVDTAGEVVAEGDSREDSEVVLARGVGRVLGTFSGPLLLRAVFSV